MNCLWTTFISVYQKIEAQTRMCTKFLSNSPSTQSSCKYFRLVDTFLKGKAARFLIWLRISSCRRRRSTVLIRSSAMETRLTSPVPPTFSPRLSITTESSRRPHFTPHRYITQTHTKWRAGRVLIGQKTLARNGVDIRTHRRVLVSWSPGRESATVIKESPLLTF